MKHKNHQVISDCKDGFVWIDGVLIPEREIKIRPVAQKTERWCPEGFSEITAWASDIAGLRMPEGANAYELVGYTERNREEGKNGFMQEIRYFNIDEAALEKKLNKLRAYF